ncbi:MAG TPA: IPT/TIG domain-containing protein [Bryobacteraceae bacterium]|nr:IPT/TIG domain-containing protein [Bryobacteraceae bacterium]
MGTTERRGRILVFSAAAALLAAAPAQAYYEYVHYLTQSAPFTPVFEKFDLSALPNKTVTFLVTDSGPANYGANDDFSSVLSQVKQAAAAWNSVDGSDLRVSFGGLEAAGQTANTPGATITFAQLPPGLLGMGGVTTGPTPVKGPNGPFFPVVSSTIMLTNDTSQAPGPSYLESFFTTAVHEFGHALGLQHTFTASAMSQAVIRNTTRARPLDADDIAGISELYPKAGASINVGSISGRVTSNGQPVVLASVVAITATGPGISAFTNPDGTYRIDNLPPNQYYVYVHPLPPDAFQGDSIRGPYDANGQTIPPSGPFETLFYPGTRDPQQFATVPVAAGTLVGGINFSVQPRSSVPMYDMITYSYSGQTPLTPAYVNASSPGISTIVAQANPPLSTPVPQSVTVLGVGSAAIRPYGSPVALALDLNVPASAGSGPRHILFNLGNDLYVLPDGLTLVQKAPPAISSVTANSDGTVTISGSNLGPDSRIFFDGLPSAVQIPFSGSQSQGSVEVIPPPGNGNQTASVIAYNSDGQNSTFYQTQAPPTYNYPASGTPQLTVNPLSLPAGVAGIVDITAANMQFVDGQVTVGLGTSDITVRRVWVLSPTHLVANVVVAPGAAIGASDISVISGSQMALWPLGFQTQGANPGQPAIFLPLFGADPRGQLALPGTILTMYGSNLAVAPNSAQITLNGQTLPILYNSAGQINFAIPPAFPTGLATLQLNNGSASALPILVQVDTPPPSIVGVVNGQEQAVDGTHASSAGDILTVLISEVNSALATMQGHFHVSVSGIDMPVVQVAPGPQPSTLQVTFVLTQGFGGFQVPLVVSLDTSHSTPYPILIH